MQKPKTNPQVQKAEKNKEEKGSKGTENLQGINKFLKQKLDMVAQELDEQDKNHLKEMKTGLCDAEEEQQSFLQVEELIADKASHLQKMVDPHTLQLVHKICSDVENEILDDINKYPEVKVIKEHVKEIHDAIADEIDFDDKHQFQEVMNIGYAPGKRPEIIQAKRNRQTLLTNYSCTTQQFQSKQDSIVEEISRVRAEHSKLVNKFRISYKKAAERAVKAVENEKKIEEEKMKEAQEKHKQMALENIEKLQKVKVERDKAVTEWQETHKPKSAKIMPHYKMKKNFEQNENIFFKQQHEKKTKFYERVPLEKLKSHIITVSANTLVHQKKKDELTKRYPNLSMDPKSFKECLKKESVKKINLNYNQRQENVRSQNEKVRSGLQTKDPTELMSTVPLTYEQKRAIFLEKQNEKVEDNCKRAQNYLHSGYIQRNNIIKSEMCERPKLEPRESVIVQMAQKRNEPVAPKPQMPNYMNDIRKNNLIQNPNSLNFFIQSSNKDNLYDDLMTKSEQLKNAGDKFTFMNKLKIDPNIKSDFLSKEDKKKIIIKNADGLYWRSIEARMALLDQLEQGL